MTKQHQHWGSRLTFIMAATGSAVGLGNIWKFPYMVGESGGAAFVLVYLLCIAAIGMPVLVAEWMLGRRGQKNPIDTMRGLARDNGRSPAWTLLGISAVLVGAVILSFYSVIGGWSLYYTVQAGAGRFAGQDADAIAGLFNQMLASPSLLLLAHTVFMLATVAIVARGLKGGIEASVRLLMPTLAALIVILLGYAATTGHFGAALSYMFAFNFNSISGDVVLAAMGQAFFTLSVGAGVMIAYGSYLGKDTNLLATARTVILFDTVFALAAGMIIFPIVFANGLETSEGPGLIFITLPLAFADMFGGTVIGLLFFVLLSFAALTSSISLLEPVAEFLTERSKMGRPRATIAAGVVIWALGIAALLSFNVWSAPLPGVGLTVFDLLDKVTSQYMLPLNGLFAVIFVGWVLNRQSVLDELGLSGTTALLWSVLSRLIAPLGVAVVFVAGLL
ncbi:sodium-dependent transporter [Rhodalgimonas zhirmunskyi]|uniref:Transporter n=1 Tax=Rhodalgimonas zhirmunskyi TaxID=2964767 RepID=A0AAJ1X596_9RHOB|nr:sodium-dependent transporter [Rhodoalgimonas zhirmunskyi]MDQ2093934.1 sodium-dependent transporter [Rhodoalgimonas zhirmunskyi]